MKKLLVVFVLLIQYVDLYSQNSLSFYHLGNTTYQSRFFNPAFVPEGRLFIGLPVLSGVHVNYNNRVSYNDVIVNRQLHNEIDLTAFLESLQKNNMMSASTGLSLFHFGFTAGSGMNFSVFANERIEADFLYPKSLMEFAIKGNVGLAGETLRIGKTGVSSVYYREYGFGLSGTISSPNSSDLSVGVNIKYLQGFMNATSDRNFTADLEFHPVDYSINLEMENAILKTAGLPLMGGGSGNLPNDFLTSKNHGAALDVGFSMQVNKRYSFSGSLIDLGFIHWRESIATYRLEDTYMHYNGIDLKGVIKGDVNLEEAFRDSLISRFVARKTENDNPYSTMLSPKMYLSGTYDMPRAGELTGTAGSRYVHGQMKFMFGAGYRQSLGRFLTATINLTRLPQQAVNFGGAIALKAGPAQVYVAMDQLMNFDATRIQSVDFRCGISFIFTERRIQSSGRSKKVKRTSSSFLGSKVRVKGKEGIYTIIERQKPRKKSEFQDEEE